MNRSSNVKEKLVQAQLKSAAHEKITSVDHEEMPKAVCSDRGDLPKVSSKKVSIKEEDENEQRSSQNLKSMFCNSDDFVSKAPAQEEMEPIQSENDLCSSRGNQSSLLTPCKPFPWPPTDPDPMAYVGVWEPWRFQVSPEE